MVMASFTFEDLEREVRALARANPDYVTGVDDRVGAVVDVACTYVKTDSSDSCIFGRALLALGVSESFLQCLEGENILNVLRVLGVPADAKQSRWAAILQASQDVRKTWGWAMLHADRVGAAEYVG